MTVRCPRCGTAYRHRARNRTGRDTTFRCARCRHVFETTRDEPTLFTDDDETFADDRSDDTPEVRTEPAFTLSDDGESDEDGEPPAAPPRTRRERAPEPVRQGAIPSHFAMRALLGITLAYAVLSIYLYTHPERLRTLVGDVPFLGPGLADARVSPGNIQLTDVRGAYQRVKGDRLVFTITATAINNARIPVRAIQMAGQISGATNNRQVVFCGAAQQDVQDLSLGEITLLQTVEPPRDWTLAPGRQAGCLVVFTEPPTDLREFAAEVVAVQAPLRRRPMEG